MPPFSSVPRRSVAEKGVGCESTRKRAPFLTRGLRPASVGSQWRVAATQAGTPPRAVTCSPTLATKRSDTGKTASSVRIIDATVPDPCSQRSRSSGWCFTTEAQSAKDANAYTNRVSFLFGAEPSTSSMDSRVVSGSSWHWSWSTRASPAAGTVTAMTPWHMHGCRFALECRPRHDAMRTPSASRTKFANITRTVESPTNATVMPAKRERRNVGVVVSAQRSSLSSWGRHLSTQVSSGSARPKISSGCRTAMDLYSDPTPPRLRRTPTNREGTSYVLASSSQALRFFRRCLGMSSSRTVTVQLVWSHTALARRTESPKRGSRRSSSPSFRVQRSRSCHWYRPGSASAAEIS
mmetsp:Transcript_1961/g.5821  ORF Transcript_1961/g.5821 Transcript_1961/m.5821 type:complete len:351 (-) Transcript_1961:56-1108(-)